jgi:hypothetical protein
MSEASALCLHHGVGTKGQGRTPAESRQALGVAAAFLQFKSLHGLTEWQHSQHGISRKILAEGKKHALALKDGSSMAWSRTRGKIRSDKTPEEHSAAAHDFWVTKTRPSELTGNTLHAPGTFKETHVKHYLDIRIEDLHASFLVQAA